jgi:hypothetical protein
MDAFYDILLEHLGNVTELKRGCIYPASTLCVAI